ncbi:MAG: dTDP-4-amino-4,6-dideoxygalactose transaminase [Candidatus Omnitrophota bacterium]|jgi:dTDP-4-amino-4,6-dideoxygalactose transaminase
MRSKTIQFNKPYISSAESRAASGAIRKSRIVGNGPYCKECESILEKRFGSRHALLTTSGTHALELALMLIGLKPGDEVICPSFTFVSTANAIVRQKAVPVFAEIDEHTLNIDPADMEKKITRKTRAVVPVHYAGVSCDMDLIMKIARKKGIAVVEDAAHGINARYHGKYLGAIGDMGAFSFHATKNVTCGEGGALLTSSDDHFDQAEIKREKGTNRAAYLKGQIDKYSWIDDGSSYVLSDILASVLLEQLKKMDDITGKRKKIFLRYRDGLQCLADKGIIILPHVPDGIDINGHIFYFRVNSEKERDNCIAKLRQSGIEATFHFVPLHTSPYGRKVLGYRPGDFPMTELASSTLIRLPIYPGLSGSDADFIIDSVKKILF